MKAIQIIEAPSNLGLINTDYALEPGVYKMPDALKNAGLTSVIQARVTRVERLPYTYGVDPDTGIRNANALRNYSEQLAEEVQRTIRNGYFSLVVGGDCSILVGIM